MKKEIKGIIYILAILLQFYVGVTLISTPEKATISHALVVIFISLPMIYISTKDHLK